MTRSAQAIGAERDLSRRVAHHGPPDEVGELASTLNRMLSRLEEAARETEVALRMQRQFVADVSHELRTPLTTLNGNISLLRREPPIGEADRREVLADMASESQRLIRLVRDLLSLARADARALQRVRPVALEPLLDDVCRQARLLDPDRSILCVPECELHILADDDATRQVLLVLMDNAVRHGRGQIRVSARLSGDTVEVAVSDEGPGIAPEDLPHVFGRFYRGQHSDAEAGSGLGLAIAKALVEAQRGTIRVESEVGGGSTFTLALQRA
jgi:signal transduction histidine kinase